MSRFNARRIHIETLRAGIREYRPAPTRAIQPAVAKNVNDGQMTSSPGPIPSAISATRMASVPDDIADAEPRSRHSGRSASNRSTSGPRINCPDFTTRRRPRAIGLRPAGSGAASPAKELSWNLHHSKPAGEDKLPAKYPAMIAAIRSLACPSP